VTDDKHERIRQRAHEIWEQAGRPEGAHMDHWDQAAAEVDAATKPKAKSPKKAAADKPKAAKVEKPAKAPAKAKSPAKKAKA